MGFIDVLNLILICLLILSVILLYLRQNRLVDLEKRYEQLNRELEDSIASFFTQLQEENEAFLSNFKRLQMEENIQQKAAKLNESLPKQESLIENEQIDIIQPHIISKKTALHAYQKNQNQTEIKEEIITQQDKELPIEKTEAINNQEEEPGVDFEKINTMLKSGAPLETIAKQLNMGVTELELMLKFQQGLK